jgi:hypothetical protein
VLSAAVVSVGAEACIRTRASWLSVLAMASVRLYKSEQNTSLRGFGVGASC